jgi:hypothetical protein|tara:strand:+ start:39053 stop:39388 length:336 start_codon:yes stop_codon:yes gene_type:complete
MDQRLQKALEHADYVTSFKNQKRVLREKYLKDCTIYYSGGQFTASREIIATLKSIDSSIFVDNNNTPIEIKTRGEFYDALVDAFSHATQSYYDSYQKLIQSERTVQGILNV